MNVMKHTIFTLDDSRIKRDLRLIPYDWWFRSVCYCVNYYINVDYYNVCHIRGVPLACMI